LFDLRGVPALFYRGPEERENSRGGARRMGVPVVAIVDTNTGSRPIDYVIPANDDAQKSVAYILGKITESLLRKR